jgi:hypothetical protein
MTGKSASNAVAPLIALLDANVLYPAELRSFLLYLVVFAAQMAVLCFVTGHDFSRADKGNQTAWALAREGNSQTSAYYLKAGRK